MRQKVVKAQAISSIQLRLVIATFFNAKMVAKVHTIASFAKNPKIRALAAWRWCHLPFLDVVFNRLTHRGEMTCIDYTTVGKHCAKNKLTLYEVE